MEKDIVKFMEHIEIKDKDFARYVDNEKGVVFTMNTVSLLPRVDYLELDKAQYETGKFENKIEKLEYNIIQVDRPSSKYARTKKEEDKYIIENQKVAVRQVWNVINAIGVYKSFITKEDALKVYGEIYDKISKFF